MAIERASFGLRLHIAMLSVLLVLAGMALAQIGNHWSMWALVLLALLLAAGLTRGLSRPLQRLAREAEAIGRFDFRDHPLVPSHVRELDQLAHSIDLMRDTLRRFLDLNLALAGEDDFARLLPRLLAEMAIAADAPGGVLYLADARGEALLPGALRIDGKQAQATALPPLPLAQAPALLRAALASTRSGKGAVDDDELRRAGLDAAFAGTHALALPLLNRRTQMVGAILLFSAQAWQRTQQEFVTALSASAAVMLETRELVRDQKNLFEALIRMIAGAIDAQSRHTGSHCERVPELTRMLAQAACAARHGPYAGFDLDAAQWEAVHIASWLHDCGKVTTPEHVVDKATKLETVHDRIHEVRTRFEVLKRDAEIRCWRGIAEGGDAAALHAARAAQWARLDAEFAFVARCNIGGEFLSADDQARLRAIGAQAWQRTLDDRIGISRDELARCAQAPPALLPAMEPLLADRPGHRIARPPGDVVAPDNPWGFRMQAPALLYDRGELHNLCVSRGTLSDEERYKINEHIMQTIVMLSALPFPKHLQAVPEIAGGHHEKMDGSGYPKGLTREQMSPVARMMAIADIFEALTAADRPYKTGKSLAEALAIMARMRDQQHIDADLFELFLHAGVHREYAARYLQPAQCGEVDIADYLAAPAAVGADSAAVTGGPGR